MKILGIETTCDETAAAVVEDGRIVLSSVIASQTDIHKKYGGIVPEVASRKHFDMLPIIVDQSLREAKLDMKDIEKIAIASSPGLPPALSVGHAFASGLALGTDKHLIKVNHLDAHISGIWLVSSKEEIEKIPYPFISLLVSGGHTQIRLVSSATSQKILGRTRDDAAGEAFDKVARMLGFDYPGGPAIDEASRLGDESVYQFPRPMIDSDNYDFSFSGLKTAVRKKIQKLQKECEKYKDEKELHNELCKNWTHDVAASFQEAVVHVLLNKTLDAANDLGVNTITLAGGVSANSRLRDLFGREAKALKYDLFYPNKKFCVDNAAMIAANAYFSED